MDSVNKKAAIATIIVLAIIAAFCSGFMENTKKYTVNDYFENVSVDVKDSSVRICLSQDNNAYVKCQRSDDVDVSGNTLKIKEEREWFRFLNFSNPKIEIYLPEREYKKLVIDAVSGSADLRDRISFEDAEVESISGSIEVDIEISNKAVFSSASGSLRLEDLNCRELSLSTISGSVKLDKVISDKSMIIETTSGSLKLDKIDSKSIEITTVSGSVNGEILSDKQYQISTLTGSVSIPESRGSESCKIETVSGSIDIE